MAQVWVPVLTRLSSTVSLKNDLLSCQRHLPNFSTLNVAVGQVVGTEARAQHNYETHLTGMRENAFNGDSITVYGPNMNLVKDPRWGRAQEVYS